VFPLLQSPLAAGFTSLQLTLGIVHGDLVGKVASYDNAKLKVSTSHSTASVCLWRLHGGWLDFTHLSATGMTDIAE
jgi:hypothetical protein